MKKIIRKITVLVCASVLFILPVSTAYAATIPVLVIDIPELGVKVYDYQILEVNDGASTALYDPTTSDRTIPVPAGKSFSLQIIADAFDADHALQVTIFAPGYSYNEILTSTNGGFFIDIPARTTDTNYHVWLNARYYDVLLYSFTTTIR